MSMPYSTPPPADEERNNERSAETILPGVKQRWRSREDGNRVTLRACKPLQEVAFYKVSGAW
jgi:hypothetical protein